MKAVKRLLALALALIMALSIPVFCYAQGEVKAAEEADAADSISLGKVADIYLIFTTANPKIPHLWIYMVNTSNETLTVGHYKLPAGESVSMGAWKDRGNGPGIHYNLERYWVKKETYGRAIAIHGSVNKLELKLITATINSHNYWNWVFNCVWFATSVWNKANLRIVPYLASPRIACAFMLLYGGRRPNFTIEKLNNPDKCYKHTDEGLEVVHRSALWTKTGV